MSYYIFAGIYERGMLFKFKDFAVLIVAALSIILPQGVAGAGQGTPDSLRAITASATALQKGELNIELANYFLVKISSKNDFATIVHIPAT